MTTTGLGSRRLARRFAFHTVFVILLLASMLLAVFPVFAQTPAPWRGEYYNNASVSGAPALVRVDSAIDFDWGDNAPGPGVNSAYFSARWTAFLYFDAATYTFNVTTDDGARLWVDDALVLDEWRSQAKKSFSATKALAAGYHSVRLEYYDGEGQAVIRLNWMPDTVSPPLVPGAESEAISKLVPESEPAPAPKAVSQRVIVIDETDPGFVWGGTQSSFYSRALGYKDHLYWTWNSDIKQHNWGKWLPFVPTAGNWEVQVYIADRYFETTSAAYEIAHNGVRDRRTIDQSRFPNQWVSLGTYYFAGGGDEYVFLSDVTGESYATRYVGLDAVRFISDPMKSVPTPQPTVAPAPTIAPTIAPPPAHKAQPPQRGCGIMPVLGFGRVWSGHSAVRTALGCPSEQEKSIYAVERSIQGGLILMRQDTGQTVTLYNNGTWQSGGDIGAWQAQPYAPKAHKGWPKPRARGAQSFVATIQEFEGGSMFWSSQRGIYVFYDSGRWARYD